jgi:uncharacterized zinc-type alcohol dehydrogenase-like protein
MAQIQGLAVHAAGAELLPFHYETGKLGSQEVEIAITHCGICHSDLHLISNDWGISQYPFIPGHEIVGTVSGCWLRGAVAQGGPARWPGLAVELLRPVRVVHAGHGKPLSRRGRNLRPPHGGYADRVRANVRFVIPIPDALDSEHAAPLLCGGITVYNPLRTHGINPSSRVGIVGIGGLGHIAIQFARVFGAEVTAFSTSAAKEEEARALGAHHFINSRESKALKEVAGTLDFILSTANADQDWGSTSRPCGPPERCALWAFPPRRSPCTPFR